MEENEQVDYNLYQGAIEALQACGNAYKIVFEISYKRNLWRINVMTKRFINKDFITAVKEAVTLVHNGHNPNDKA